MLGSKSKFACLAMLCLIGVESTFAQTDQAEFLKKKGLRRARDRYILAAEDEVWQLYDTASRDRTEALQADEEAGQAGARNQDIINYRNRIAFDAALRDQMRVEMRDGTSAEEQATRRSARRDLNLQKQQRAMQGLAGKRENPKEAKRLTDAAVAAYRKAEGSQAELVEKVREVDAQYGRLAGDPKVRGALGNSRLLPSEKFKNLALNLGIAKKNQRGKTAPPVSPPKDAAEAVAELEESIAVLKAVNFRRNMKGFAARDQRRSDTIAAIEGAIERLNRGEVDPKVLDEAITLHGGYTGSSAPDVSDGLAEVRIHLRKAAELLGRK